MPNGYRRAFAALALALAALLLAHGPAAAGENGFCATLIELSGTVAVMNPDHAEWIPAVQDMPLSEGLVIRTGAGSFAEVLLDDGSHLRLGADTEVTLDRVSIGENGSITGTLALWAGRLMSSVAALRGPDSSFQVRTANSVAGVRGTQFLVEVPRAGDTVVCVYEGRVDVAAGGPTPTPEAAVLVPAGMETRLRGRAAPMEPFRLSPAMESLRPMMQDLRSKADDLRRRILEIKERRGKIPPDLLRKLRRAQRQAVREAVRFKKSKSLAEYLRKRRQAAEKRQEDAGDDGPASAAGAAP